MAPNDASAPSIGAYVKHAFLYPWNLLFFVGGAALAAMSPWPDALLPIVGGLEIAYLTGLSSIPRFRTAIDAQARGESARRQLGRAAPAASAAVARSACSSRCRRRRCGASCCCASAASRCASITSGIRGQADARDRLRRVDPDAGAGSAALPLPATARVAERARSISAQHEREGPRREARPTSAARLEAAQDRERRARDAIAAGQPRRRASSGSTTTGRA